jgi:small subunit ribosomal protein S13
MARLMGVDIPNDKRIEVALTYIFGVGPAIAKRILEQTNISGDLRTKDLTDDELNRLSVIIQRDYQVEGDLRREVQANVKRLMDVGAYRGLRHRRGLPVRGQRTSTNARTRKGPRRAVARKKK